METKTSQDGHPALVTVLLLLQTIMMAISLILQL
jgi:hypothetical protein